MPSPGDDGRNVHAELFQHHHQRDPEKSDKDHVPEEAGQRLHPSLPLERAHVCAPVSREGGFDPAYNAVADLEQNICSYKYQEYPEAGRYEPVENLLCIIRIKYPG